LLITSGLNGYPTIQFDNDQTDYDFLRVPDNSTLEGMNGLTGFVVYQLLAGTAANAPRCFFSKRDGVDTQEAYDWFLWNNGSNVQQHLDIVNTNNRANSSGNYATGTTYLNGFTYHGATPSDANDQILYDGNAAVGNRSEAATSIPNYTSDLYVGILRGHTGTGVNVSRFNGYISEIILYNTVLNDAQRIIVNNYLSAKYNAALSSVDLYRQDDAGQGNYDHEVAGVGRMTTGMQSDSRGTGIVQMSGATGLDNNEFLFWGHNNEGLGTFGVIDLPAGIEGRWQRTWRVNEVNTSGTAVDVGAVDITFDLSTFGNVNPDEVRLLVDTDNDHVFADETPIGAALAVGGGRYRFPGVTALINNVRFTLGTINIGNTPLPIRLLSFDGEETTNGRIALSWVTGSEQQSAYFTVERSADHEHWTDVARTNAAGNSSALIHYGAFDNEPRNGTTYYRLRQTDQDGTWTLSGTVSVALDHASDIEIWPNPANDLVHVQLPGGTIARIDLIDPQGRIVHVASGQGDDTITLPLHLFNTGQYMIRMETSIGLVVRKLLIEHDSQ